ncbi:MAG: XTP/dITP diphosphatase [Candidatus Aminicenantes bacterium]|nr:MAG: XTP/dITP diphosphatase [Candidatus Aminicenantes bacterium]
MNKRRLLLATTNQGKAREIESYLEDLNIEILSLKELGQSEFFSETGTTFDENARGKSLFYSMNWEGLTLAEDSGLEIEALNGEPGVLSARYSGEQATDEKNNQKVLERIKEVPSEKRKARFVSCMVLSQKGKIITEIKESVEGVITFEEKGTHGFGYDPLFYYPPLKKTFAKLQPEEKNKVSHRGRALKKLKEYLLTHLGSDL